MIEQVQPKVLSTEPIAEPNIETDVVTDSAPETQEEQGIESAENQLVSPNPPNNGKENETPNWPDIQVQK